MNLRVDETVELRLLRLSDAKDIYETINRQRKYLGKWLPFVEHTHSIDPVQSFVNSVVNKPQASCEMAFTIRKDSVFVGLVDLKTTDLVNRKTEIGYWLSEDHQNQGIMTRSVARICAFAFDELDLNRIQIKCAVGNTPSSDIAKRLNFYFEGIERDGELLSNDTYVDLEVYSKLKSDG